MCILHIWGLKPLCKPHKKNQVFTIYTSLANTSEDNMNIKLHPQYYEFKNVFEKKNADILLKHQSYDCAIELQDGTQSPFGSIYNLSQTKLSALGKYINKNLSKNFIKYSKSLTRIPILLVKKMDFYGCALITVAFQSVALYLVLVFNMLFLIIMRIILVYLVFFLFYSSYP